MSPLLSTHQEGELHLFRQLQQDVESKTLDLTTSISDLQTEAARLVCRDEDPQSILDQDVVRNGPANATARSLESNHMFRVEGSGERAAEEGQDFDAEVMSNAGVVPTRTSEDLATKRCSNALISRARLWRINRLLLPIYLLCLDPRNGADLYVKAPKSSEAVMHDLVPAHSLPSACGGRVPDMPRPASKDGSGVRRCLHPGDG